MKRILNGLISIALLGASAPQLTAVSPTIAGVNCFGTIPAQIISPATVTREISFLVNDPDPGQTLRISGTSSDQTLVPDSNIIFDNPVATSGGPSVRNVLVLAGIAIGTTTITLSVADNETPPKTNSISFTLQVARGDENWANPQEIIIRDRATAVEYPSVISIRDYTGTIEKVTVNIIGFSHPFPDDVDMLLVSPHGESLLLMSDAGGGVSVSNVRLTFDDDASKVIPDESSGALVSGTSYKPSNYEGNADPFMAPAPAGPYPATALSVFNGQSPNGDWKLYVMDDTFPDAGVINGGWNLQFTTRTVITGLPASVTILENTTANVGFAITEDSFLPPDFRFTFTSSNTVVVGTNGVSFDTTGAGYHALVTPQTNAIGTSVITIFATRADCQVATGTFTLIVQPFNTVPSFNVGVDQTVYEDPGPQTVEGWATHISTGLADESDQTVTFHVTTNSNPGLFSVGPAVSSLGTLTFTPAANANGSATISLVAQDDGGTLNGGVDTSDVQTFTITVNAVEDPPVVTTSRNLMTTEMNRPITIVFEIGDVDSTLRISTLVVTSSNDAVVPNRPANLAISGSDVLAGTTGTINVTVTPEAGVMGTTVITLTATDGNTSVSIKVTLIVGPRNTPPTIAGTNCFGTIPTQTVIPGGVTENIPFLVNDPDHGQTLGILATSSNQTLVKNSNIIFDNPIALSGGPSVRNVRIAVEPGTEGLTTITLSVADDGNPPRTNSISFTLIVGYFDPRFFSNTRPLTIRDNDTAVDYPSEINISGYRGVLSKVEVHIWGFAHRFPDDVDMLLVSPHGEKLLLMSDAGGGTVVTNINFKFDDFASPSLPDTSLNSGTFRPGNYDDDNDPFPAPAPAGPYPATALSVFNGQSPNGDWKLYIADDTAQDAGFITGGWSLTFATRPLITGLPDSVTVSENTQASVSFILAEESFTQTDFVFTFASANTEVVGTNGVSFLSTSTGYSAIVTPRPNTTGTSVITIFATSPDCEVTTAQFTVNVIPSELRLSYELLSTNGAPALRVFSPSGMPYQLETSTEMLNWLPVFTNQNGAAEGGFIEMPLTNRLQRFFRAKQL